MALADCSLCKTTITTKLPIFIDGYECPICLSTEVNEGYYYLNCGHVFHKNCLSGTLSSSSSSIPPSIIIINLINKVRFDEPVRRSSVYNTNPEENFASLNSGNYELSTVDSGINRGFFSYCGVISEFNKLLYNIDYPVINEIEWLKKLNVYSPLCPDIRSHERFKSICCYKDPELIHPNVIGFTSMYVYKEDNRPENNIKNTAMVYTVGPNCNVRYGGENRPKEDFLNDLKKVGRNISMLLKLYNESIIESDKIKIMKICLVSGGFNRHREATKVEIAKALIIGLSNDYDSDITYVFSYDENSFKHAYDQLLNT